MSLVVMSTKTKPTSLPFSLRTDGGPVLYLMSAKSEIVDGADPQPVARRGFAVHHKIEKITAHRALGECAARVWKIGELFFNLHRNLLNFAEIGTENYYPEDAAKTGSEHFRARLDRHPEDARHARRLNVGVDFRYQLVPRHFLAPLARRFEC